MKVHRPSYWSTIAITVTTINAIIAVAIGAWVLVAGFVVLLGLMWLGRREERNRPIAEIDAGEVRLRGGALAADFQASSILNWKRDGKTLAISLEGGGEIRFGPFFSEGPALELEKVLERGLASRD